ncbi:hypothetical protein JM949_04240, partial [Micromonospora sp. STR1s_6]|nr:hypothetical protein [Micromonospora tarensis]
MTKQPGRVPAAESDEPAVDPAGPSSRPLPAPGAAVLGLLALGGWPPCSGPT